MLKLIILQIIFVIAALCSTACRTSFFDNKNSDSNGAQNLSEINNSLPFTVREPENFRAEFVFTSRYDAEDTEPISQKTIVYRAGNNRRIDFETPRGDFLTKLQTADGKEFIFAANEKFFTEVTGSNALTANFSPEYSLENILHTKPFGGRFEKAGEEEISGFQTVKYKLIFSADESADNVQTEIFVWHNEKLGFPVKTEVSAVETGQKTGAVSIMELQNFAEANSPDTFILPADFRRISAAEMQNILKMR